MRNKQFAIYILIIAITAVIAFFIHISVLSYLNFPLFDNKIILSYVVNTLLVILILLVLFIFKKKLKDQLGFLFMAGSLLKFACFFIFFYPSFKMDGDISNLEFAAFFVPYAICLIVETICGSKLLNSLK